MRGGEKAKALLEKLWNEYLSDECAAIDTEEERALIKVVAELHESANALLNKDQSEAVEECIDALCDIESLFAKKAFFKGCEFGVSFLLDTVTDKQNFNRKHFI